MGDTDVPSLSRLHLTSKNPFDVGMVMTSLSEVLIDEEDQLYLLDEHDAFRFEEPGAWSFTEFSDALIEAAEKANTNPKSRTKGKERSRLIGYNKPTLRVVVHREILPAPKETPYFNHELFYCYLELLSSGMHAGDVNFGHFLLYGDVVESTNTLLEK